MRMRHIYILLCDLESNAMPIMMAETLHLSKNNMSSDNNILISQYLTQRGLKDRSILYGQEC